MTPLCTDATICKSECKYTRCNAAAWPKASLTMPRSRIHVSVTYREYHRQTAGDPGGAGGEASARPCARGGSEIAFTRLDRVVRNICIFAGHRCIPPPSSCPSPPSRPDLRKTVLSGQHITVFSVSSFPLIPPSLDFSSYSHLGS